MTRLPAIAAAVLLTLAYAWIGQMIALALTAPLPEFPL
jgi:hypothetical protein